MPKVYLVVDKGADNSMCVEIYGVFTKKEKALEIKEELCKNFIEHDVESYIEVVELTLDECTDDYYYYMNN